MSLKTFGRISSFSFAIFHRVCLLCRIWFASKMEKFSNDFLTAGIAALPLSFFRCCELNYWLRSQCTCETWTRKLLIRSVRCLFVFFFLLFLASSPAYFLPSMESAGKSPIVCIRRVHFIHYHPLLVYSNFFSPVALAATPFSHDNFHFVFIAVSVRASVIRPFVVNFFLDLYLISDRRKWPDFFMKVESHRSSNFVRQNAFELK